MIFQITGGSGFFLNFRIKELLVPSFEKKSESGNRWFWVLQKHQRTGTLHEGTSNGLVGRKKVS
jgi:hypothetical protein